MFITIRICQGQGRRKTINALPLDHKDDPENILISFITTPFPSGEKKKHQVCDHNASFSYVRTNICLPERALYKVAVCMSWTFGVLPTLFLSKCAEASNNIRTGKTGPVLQGLS